MEQRLQEELYWKSRWENNQTGWHLSAPNSILVENFSELAPRPNLAFNETPRTAFVPLCGKSLDIQWLKDQNYFVVGCEVSEKAVTELFLEMGVKPRVYLERQTNGKDVTVWEYENVKIYVANFFDLGVLNVDAVFDRAALVALPANTRQQYTRHMVEITRRAPQLLIAFEHSRSTEPPHSVPLDLLQQYYGGIYDIEPIVRRMTNNDIIEAAYLLTIR